MSWHSVSDLARLSDGPILFKKSPKQIAVFKSADSIYAVDNRCHHEGYPLIEGSVDDACLLTCNWHNWKFQPSDGKCVLGGDNVKTYPTKIEDGQVWVDLTDPPPEVLEEEILGGLHAAFQKREFDRICREITRLKFSGIDPTAALRWHDARFCRHRRLVSAGRLF